MSGLFGGGKSQATTNPVLNAMQINSATYGSAVPLVYGQTRLPGMLIWYGDFTATPHSQSQGGKGGGGGGGSTSYTYSSALMLGICEGPVSGIVQSYVDKGLDASLADQNLTLFTGALGQSTWSYLTTNHPTQALGYSEMAYVCSGAYQMGSSSGIPNITFEVQALLNGSAPVPGAEPYAILNDYLTHATHGASFPYVDSYFQGTTADSFRTYCTALGIRLSPAELSQRSATDFVAEILKICNAEAVWSAGVLKVIPYGDTAITANSVTFTPSNGNGGSISTPIYSFTDDDFLEDGDDPVKCERKPTFQPFNVYSVEFLDRTNQYNISPAVASDSSNISQYGYRAAPVLQYHEITDVSVARLVAQMILQRALYYRNVYTFKVRCDYSLLEPMDIVAITDSGLGIANKLVRVIEVHDSPDDELELVCEDVLLGPGHAAAYNWSGSQGFAANSLVSPGSVAAPCIFTLPPLLVGGSGGYELGIAVGGAGAAWAGANVWMSYDGTNYVQVGAIVGPSKYGTLRAAITSVLTDPEITNTVATQLVVTSQTMAAGSQADVDNLNTLIYVDGEIMAYRDSALVSAGQYNLTYLHRGLYGSAIAAHAISAPWARLDHTLLRVPFDPGRAGQTAYFKFTSFNAYGMAQEALSGVTAYTHVIGDAAQPTDSLGFICTNVTAVGLSYTKTGGTANTWDSQVYSQNAYPSCIAQAAVHAGSVSIMFGLSVSPAAVGFANIDYAMYNNAGVLSAYSLGSNLGVIGSCVAGDKLSVTYDGSFVRWIQNGTVIYSMTVEYKTFYFKAAFYTAGCQWDGVSFAQLHPGAQPGNLLNTKAWTVGTTGSQNNFGAQAVAAANAIFLANSTVPGPYGGTEPVWQVAPDASTAAVNGYQGGWVNTGDLIGIDSSKTYRFVAWVRVGGSAIAGNIYLGTNTDSNVCAVGTQTVNSNPYFVPAQSTTTLVSGRWYLMVGIVHGSGYPGANSGVGGIYDPTTGAQILVGTDYNWLAGATATNHRCFLFGVSSTTTRAYFARPRVELLDGSEPTIQALLAPATLDALPDGTTYGKVKGTALTSGSVDPSKAGVLTRGSIPPTIPGDTFTYTSTTTSITISWVAFTLYRADGTTISISSGSQLCSTLSASTTYYFYPYFTDTGGSSGTLNFAIGSSGMVGTSSAIALPSTATNAQLGAAGATMYQQGRIPLGKVTGVTPASGSGGGGGGGGLQCLSPTQLVDTDAGRCYARELNVGDKVRTPNGYQPILGIREAPVNEWRIVGFSNHETVWVTPDHRFMAPDGSQRAARDLLIGEILAGDGRNVEVERIDRRFFRDHCVGIELSDPHLYYVNRGGVLSHNIKP